ncbi:PLP-dependent aminotransferase family protein [Pedobacter sp. AW31-3R]|uniref:aminotransferase-like domain-containing protein n=1 Tax=Pedobacter sp. AW31-3R TaxID=3445781 RepID=UPI003F9F8203
MDSPVQIPFKSFIHLKPEEPTALYLQLVFEFIKAIQTGRLPEGTKLPGTRVLCRLLSINRNTLIKAFEDLSLQGYVEIRANIGTFILAGQQQRNGIKAGQSDGQPGSGGLTAFDFRRSSLLDDPIEASDLPLQFNDGLPDLRLVYTDVLARLYTSKLKKRKNAGSWEQIQSYAHSNFKNHFSNFLNLTRCLRISTSNLLTASSHEISLFLVTRLLIAKGDRVVVASPGYYRSNMTLSDTGAQIIPVAVDGDGMNTDQLRQICEKHKISVVYLTSNYHYPATIALSAKRRVEMLKLANQYGFVIVEDDYDFDFHYDNNPGLPLAAFDNHERVVYIGSFGKSLPSGFGYGFIVAPAAFIRELEKHRNFLEPGTDVVKEQVLTDWIEDGEVHRLSKKNKKIYRERRDLFVSLLHTHLKAHIRFRVPNRGLAVYVEWLDPFNLINLQKACAANGLFLPKTILYQTKTSTATRLGFGHLDQEEMKKAVEILALSLHRVLTGDDHSLQ